MLVLEKLNILKRPVKPQSTLGIWSAYDGNLAGGALVGVGMALSGACPGTVLVQLAQGIPSANLTAAGALVGAGAYVQTKHLLTKVPRSDGTSELAAQKVTISEASRIPELALYLLFGAALVVVLRFTQTGTASSLVSPVFGGLLIGSAQAVSLLLTSSPLGVSMGYEQLSRMIIRAFKGDWTKPALPHRSIIFSLGVIAGSTALLEQSSVSRHAAVDAYIPTAHAFVGGILLTFGARLGGGCTSGHGLSGLSAMSFSSLVTAVAMFGAGIVTRSLM